MNERLNVLLLEDNASDGLLINRRLKKNWDNLKLTQIYKEKDLRHELEENDWDVIISDYNMPNFDGQRALEIVKEYEKDIPFIVVSGTIGEDKAAEIMRMGAHDYVLKDNPDRLIPAIERELKEAKVRHNKKITEKALRNSERYWSITFSAIADGIFLLDQNGKIKQFNPAAQKILNIDHDNIIGLTCPQLTDLIKGNEDEYICLYDKMKKGSRRVSNEMCFNDRWYNVTLDPIFSERDEIVSAVCIMKDITETVKSRIDLERVNIELEKMHRDLELRIENAVRKSKAQQHLILQQTRLAATGDMLSQIAHHWRQPLNTMGVLIQGLGDAIEFDELDKDKINDRIEQIMEVSKELSVSIDLFRNVHSAESSISEFCVKSYLENIIKALDRKFPDANISITKQIGEKCIIYGFASEFTHALSQILENAYEVLIKREITEPYVKITCTENDDYINISVIDNGGGIEQNIKETMFDLYSTTKPNLNNTGVGLFTARLIIEKNMQGSIEVLETQNETEFIITLPKKGNK